MTLPLRFSVMTFNLRFGLADDGPNSWENRKKAYPEFFSRFQPDFIGFQEVNPFQVEFLADLLDGYGYTGQRENAPERWQHNLVFFRKTWDPIFSRHYFLSPTPERESRFDGSRWPRQCVVAGFEKDGQRLAVVTTHFDFSETVQTRSAYALLAFLEELEGDWPVVVTGDFNADPGGQAHRILLGGGFSDAFDGRHTFTFHKFTGKEKGGHIDWILFRGSLGVTGRRIIRDRFAGIFPTDHFPVIVDFRLPARSAEHPAGCLQEGMG